MERNIILRIKKKTKWVQMQKKNKMYDYYTHKIICIRKGDSK